MESWVIDHDKDLAHYIEGSRKQGIDAKIESGAFLRLFTFFLKLDTQEYLPGFTP